MTADSVRQWLPVPAVAKLWVCSPEKVHGLIKSGALRAVDISDTPGTGRPKWRIRPEDLEQFVRSRSNSPPPPRPKKKRTREFKRYV